jgi:amino acid adenylation domain-containing protein
MMSLLQNYVTERAERLPDAIAVVSQEETLSYGELEAESNELARLLRDAGCSRGDRICLLAPKSPAAIVAILAIYKSDCIYVPLDPASPAPRLSKIIAQCDPSWILAGGQVAPLLDELFLNDAIRDRVRVGWLELEPEWGERFQPAFDFSDVLRYPSGGLPYRNSDHDAAHLLFTSGSTGTPKGVLITHANVIRFVEWAVQYFGITASDRQSCYSPLHFDLSVFDIFGTLTAGASLHLMPGDLSLFPNRLADFIRNSQLTQWFSVPSLLAYMANLDVIRFNDFPNLKRLLWCGEVLATPTLIHWMRRLPHVSFTNLYGPTETTIASSYYTIPSCPATDTASIAIGTPCTGETFHVLDAGLQPVPPGIVGELYIGGVGLSPGYWRDSEATRSAFVPDPFSSDDSQRLYRTGDLASVGPDGQFYYHGRTDSQVKTRGHRVELREIEVVLESSSRVQECAVVAIASSGFEGQSICCAYVPARDRTVTAAMLRKELTANIPTWMVPTEWIEFPALPKNSNGKIDRQFLRNEFLRRKDQIPRQRGIGRALTEGRSEAEAV